jgi:hypothetical protein
MLPSPSEFVIVVVRSANETAFIVTLAEQTTKRLPDFRRAKGNQTLPKRIKPTARVATNEIQIERTKLNPNGHRNNNNFARSPAHRRQANTGLSQPNCCGNPLHGLANLAAVCWTGQLPGR